MKSLAFVIFSRFLAHVAASAGVVTLSVRLLYRAATTFEAILSLGIGLFLIGYIHVLSHQRVDAEEDRDRLQRLLNLFFSTVNDRH